MVSKIAEAIRLGEECKTEKRNKWPDNEINEWEYHSPPSIPFENVRVKKSVTKLMICNAETK